MYLKAALVILLVSSTLVQARGIELVAKKNFKLEDDDTILVSNFPGRKCSLHAKIPDTGPRFVQIKKGETYFANSSLIYSWTSSTYRGKRYSRSAKMSFIVNPSVGFYLSLNCFVKIIDHSSAYLFDDHRRDFANPSAAHRALISKVTEGFNATHLPSKYFSAAVLYE